MSHLKECQCENRWGVKSENCLGWFKPTSAKNIFCPACKSIAKKATKRKYDDSHRYIPLGTKLKCACGCGSEFIKKNGNQNYAPNCPEPYWKRYKESMRLKNKRENTKTATPWKVTLCKCPMCDKKYNKKIFWDGREPARLYCDNCVRLVPEYSAAEGW